ncbi:acyltransferase [Flavobacterium sp. H122]|uniref:acyltransferase family protein n=1 Tax=Flavobacterium sp. H122 TaxID=2529860 RepID=UPI0010AB3AB3|nr:acyltransferase [Flavobacterium sp. H122]
MRNNNLDILKVVMAFLVIALHVFPVSKIGGIEGLISYEIASGITRIAVPTFFLISGYFLRNKLNDKAYLWKYAKRILLLYIVWQLIYLPDLYRFYYLGWFSHTSMILKLIYGYWHLWYLLATVLAVGILYFIRDFSLASKAFLSIALLVIGYVYQILIQADLIHRNLDLQFLYEVIGTTRNFLFFAFPMMLIGTMYESWKSKIEKIKSLLVPLWLLLMTEVGFYYMHGVKAMDFLIVLPLLSMLVFYWVKKSKPVTAATIHPTLSLGVYLCHPYAIRIVNEFLPEKGFYDWLVKYPIICLLALGLWWLVDKVNKKFSCFL